MATKSAEEKAAEAEAAAQAAAQKAAEQRSEAEQEADTQQNVEAVASDDDKPTKAQKAERKRLDAAADDGDFTTPKRDHANPKTHDDAEQAAVDRAKADKIY